MSKWRLAPLERVRACPEADPAAVARLTALRERLDPFVLAKTIDRKLERAVLPVSRSTQALFLSKA